MNKFLAIVIMGFFIIILVACQKKVPEDKEMFTNKIQKLIGAKDEDSEEEALGELLVSAKQTGITYGYRVFDMMIN